MLEIRIDLVPYGRESGRRELGRLRIVNDGTGDYLIGNYTVNAEVHHIPDRVWLGRVEGFERRDRDVLDLLRLALNALVSPAEQASDLVERLESDTCSAHSTSS